MKIAIDVSPVSQSSLHKVRGVGMYIKNLTENLQKIDKKNTYVFIEKKEDLSNNIDVIHFPYFDPFFLTLPLKNKTKTIVTVHDLTPIIFKKNFHSGIKGAIKWNIQKRLLKKVDKIITDSDSSKKDISRILGINPGKISVICLAPANSFNKLEGGEWEKTLRKKYDLPEKFALYVGDVTWNKNLPNLVDAFLKTNIPLVMVGKALVNKDFDKKNPWNSDLLQIINKIENEKQFLRLGFLSEEELVQIYNLATLFVMPSFYEGFGLPVVEAMRCGCPVVTTREGSLKEVAGDAALFVETNIDSIKEGVEKVFSDINLQKELSQKGQEQAKKFTWEKTARDTIKCYESLS